MTELPRPDAILFDLDCTLTDRAKSLEQYAALFSDVFASRLEAVNQRDLLDQIAVADGGGYRSRSEFAQTLTTSLCWQTTLDWQEIETHWRAAFPGCTMPAHDHLTDILAGLRGRGLRLGIVTNGASGSQHPKIDTLGIRSFFDAIVISGEIGIKKPDPAIFRHALGLLDVPANAAWFVGDHPVNDILGAGAVGITPIWLTGIHAWPKSDPSPRFVIHSLDEVPVLVDASASVASTTSSAQGHVA